jgi:hypothetical protein
MTLSTIKQLGKVDISYPMKALLVELMVKWEEYAGERVEVSMNDATIGIIWSAFGRELTKNKKDLSLVIRDYMDGVEKVIKKHSQTLRSAFTNYVKDRELKPDPDSGERELWDELVVNNFKIKKIHVASEYGEDFQDDDDIEGFPHQVWPDDRDLGDYIARTVQRGK